MAKDLHLLTNVVEELEKLALHTSQGSYVKMEDVRRLAKERQEEQTPDPEADPPPTTVVQARAQAKKYLGEQGAKLEGPPDAGRAIPAQQSQPPSRA